MTSRRTRNRHSHRKTDPTNLHDGDNTADNTAGNCQPLHPDADAATDALTTGGSSLKAERIQRQAPDEPTGGDTSSLKAERIQRQAPDQPMGPGSSPGSAAGEEPDDTAAGS